MSTTPERDGMPLVRSNLVWDLLVHEDAPDMLRLLDMTPPGPDGVELAIKDSHIRHARVKPIHGPIDVLTTEISEIYIKAILGEAASELGEEIVDDLISTYEEFLGAGLKVAIAQLMAAGILTYNTRTAR